MKEFFEGLVSFDPGVPDPSELISDDVQWYHELGVEAPTKGRFWITNGTDTKMTKGEIPEGWWKGRGKVSEELRGKRQKMTLENNPNAKTYKIVYRDGTEEIVKQLNKWARSKGHTVNQVKSIVRRTKRNNIKFLCKTSATYYIKEIVPVDELVRTH